MGIITGISTLILLVGHFWFAYEVWQRETLIWALLLLIVPFPLLGLYIWYRSGWERCYRTPALMYLVGYGLEVITSIA